MRTLVIDCATEACSVALFDGEDLACGTFEILGRGHAERLVPMISELPDHGRSERIAAALGPGSFTGVRVGLAAARALALAWDAEFIGYPTLALVASMARLQAGNVPVGVAMNAGHGEWFVSGFDGAGTQTSGVASLIPDRARHVTKEEVVAGTRAKELVASRGWGAALEILPDARSFSVLPPSFLIDDPAPLYVRGPDAKLPGAVS